MYFRQLVLGLLCLVPAWAWSVCPPHKMAGPGAVRLQGDAVLIVVHPTSTYDARFASKRGIDEAVRFAKGQKIPVVYLQDDSPEEFYFTKDCAPDHWVYSDEGELNFDVTPAHVYVAGGHLELCLATALNEILYQWAKKAPRNLKITFLMDGIYSNGKVIDPGDPFYADFLKFRDIVTYGRPGGEHWPKISLLETMGVIMKEEHELEYIKQVLPRWDKTMPKTYRVDVTLNHSVTKVLRPAPGWNPPTLSFHFVDSAINLAPPPASGDR